ncbi:major facilitator superfamily domain-containing protein [Lasiosphaeris hirsuta]|uniref:Major facilitator superfamily domain-containing protein n=1 Tax=Lasiosphaeris hirsuta TaxID=260670 RepID=A0AA40B9F8_9PEZI|nr:major facilitator superfamily domain-containing protein [Lasiosphaeris hirsuta]
MFFLVALAKFAAFTDIFLSGLVIPLIPSIIESRLHVPHEQVQILTSVLISAHGGAFAAVSPLMPFLTRQGASVWLVFVGGLACATLSFLLLQFHFSLLALVLSRALQGLAAAAATGACSGLVVAATGPAAETNTLSWITPALLQSTAMTAAPAAAGYLYGYVGGETAVFYCAYTAIALSLVLGLLAAIFAPRVRTQVEPHTLDDTDELLAPEHPTRAYGTISIDAGLSLRGGGGLSAYTSRSGSRASSRSRRGSIGSDISTIEETGPVFGIRLFTALYGYLIIGLLTTALYSVIPQFVAQHFRWTVATGGFALVPLSAPAVLVGPLARMLAGRLPKSERYLVAFGFLFCVAVLVHLSLLTKDTQTVQLAFLIMLGAMSVGVGLCADPLIKEITCLTVGGDQLQAATLPNLVHAWGSLIGPLFAGGINWVWGWQTMTKSLGATSAFAALFTLLFLQGWIGHAQYQDGNARSRSDEESAPLLARSGQNGGAFRSTRSYYGNEQPAGLGLDKTVYFDRNVISGAGVDGSEDLGSSVRTDGTHQPTKHRRHFSIDNFSIATTAVDGRLNLQSSPNPDPDMPQVRFQAALETAPALGSSFKTQLSSTERRFVMREAPHAPATDPLLAAGNRYVIDEAAIPDGSSATSTSTVTKKRHVVVFEEGAVPPGLLERRQHHVVAINSLDGSVKLASIAASKEEHAVSVTEEEASEMPEGSRRYVVVMLEEGDEGVEESL